MIQWEQVRIETAQLLQELIRIDTTNPPGNELAAAVLLQTVFQAEGIDTQIYRAAPTRGSLIARLPGKSGAKPLILLGHTDVVSANPAQWSHPPFAGEIVDDFVWGRGALDMKGMLAMEAMALILLKRNQIIPERDILFIAVADEETGGGQGIEWLMEQDIPGLREAEYVINEGSTGMIRDGIPIFACQTGEKGVLWVKLTIPGTPGHASMPTSNNAIFKMMKVIDRLEKGKHPVTFSNSSRAFIKELALQKGLSLSAEHLALDYSLQLFVAQHLKHERSVQAMLYNTISPTIIQSGSKVNILPDFCELTLDCRLLPGETPGKFLAKLQKTINDPSVTYEIIQAADPTESSYDTALFAVIRQVIQEERPDAMIVPYLSPLSTDSRFFRFRNITAYGLIPIIITEAELQTIHGVDERISLDNIEQGTRILYKIAQQV